MTNKNEQILNEGILADFVTVKSKFVAFPSGIHQVFVENDEVNDMELILKSFKEKENYRLLLGYEEESDFRIDGLENININTKALLIKPLEIKKVKNSNLYKMVYRIISSVNITHLSEMVFELPKKLFKDLVKKWDMERLLAFDIDQDEENNVALAFKDTWLDLIIDDSKPLFESFDLDSFLTIVTQVLTTTNRNFEFSGVGKDILNIFQENLETKKPYTYHEINNLIRKYIQEIDIFVESKQNKLNQVISILNFIDTNVIRDKSKAAFNPSLESINATIFSIGDFLQTNLELDNELTEKMNEKLSKQQKEFMLREKMKSIQETLESMGSSANEDDEYAKDLKDPLRALIYPSSVQKIIADETKRFSEMMQTSPEANISKTYVELLKKLPWRKVQKELLDINRVRKVLDHYHYGLDEVKERIVEYIAVMINSKSKSKGLKFDLDENDEQVDWSLFKGDEKVHFLDADDKADFNNVPIITLVGPPGTGKTSLAKAIAESLNRKFVKISLGGVHDESEIRGHRRTYVGAMPGKIIKGIKQAGVSNPVVLLDEIDKMASDIKGDPASAMLEVLDPEQNTKFQDHYVEHEYDLSKVVFIATANYYENIPHALIDRVEIIELSPYTLNEKLHIAKNHLIPKVIKQSYLKPAQFKIDDETLKYIIKHYTAEAGVRGLKRILDKIARKIVVKVIDDKKLKEFVVTIDKLEDLIGVIKYKEDEKETELEPGTTNGLAYTSVGGSALQIEVNVYPGKGEIKLTGSLKEVMQESAQIALTYVRSNAEKFGIKDFDFENSTIHIHVPEGAVPKDGPSAGVTFTTAIISALSQRAVSAEYAMTGEITLRGKVLEIGGLKEKSFGAIQKGIKYIFIPETNVKNLRDIPSEIKAELTYIPVKKYDQIYDVLFMHKKPEVVITEEKKDK